MDPTTQGLLLLLVGIVIGSVTMLSWRLSERELRASPTATSDSEANAVPPAVGTVLSVLGSSALVVDEELQVLQASAPAYVLGLVRDGELQIDDLRDLVRQVRRDGLTRQVELDVSQGPGKVSSHVHARVAALSSRLVLVLAEDRTRERRVEAIRRDFVANVSHELKTPVGALTLLTEAVEEAAGDPEAVTRFAARMRIEAERLSRLVQQIIELSRLQGDVAPDQPTLLRVDDVVERAMDVNAIEAAAKEIDLYFEGLSGLKAIGDSNQVALALSNLVANAVAYSPSHSKVTVSAVPEELTVAISVTDQGIGIPAAEIDRIFERFYRVDPARHRSTGGTGLGLSIVKHVAASHGGEVTVVSEEGKGSTFTLRLPRRSPSSPPPPAEASRLVARTVTSSGANRHFLGGGAPADQHDQERP